MLDIEIVTIGSVKEKWIKEGIQEYLKRLKPYARIRVIELKAEAFGNTQKEKAKSIESQKIVEFLQKETEAQIYFLDEYGKNPNSKEFGSMIDKIPNKIIFVVAGALGYDRDILENKSAPWRDKQTISLSNMTLTHEMARLVLLEQIYRGICIAKDKKYHY